MEITKDSELTIRGDCIIGVNASCGCYDLPVQLKKRLQDPDRIVTFTITVNDQSFILQGRGHSDLTLTHKDDIVIRKSDFVCPRTLAVLCDKASDSLPQRMVKLLQNPKTVGNLVIETD